MPASPVRVPSGDQAAMPTQSGWPTVVGGVAMGLLLFIALFAGVLPGPLFGIVLLVAARSIFRRLD